MGLLALFVLLWPWGAEAVLLVRAEGRRASVVERGEAVVRAGEPAEGEPAVDLLKQAVAMQKARVEGAPRVELPGGEWVYYDFSAAGGERMHEDPEAQRIAREHEIELLKRLEAEGLFELVLRAGRVPRDVVWSYPDPEARDMFPEPQLGDLRRLARANRARLVLASEAGEWDRYLSAAEVNLVLGRLCAKRGTLIQRLVGLSMYPAVCERVWVDAPRMPAATLERLQRLLDEYAVPARDVTLRLNRLDVEWVTDKLFTDGPLGGRPIPSVFSELFGFADALYAITGEEEPWTASIPDGPAWNLVAVPLASKSETLRVLDRQYADIERGAALDLPSRRAQDRTNSPRGFRHAYTRELEEVYITAFEKWLDSEDGVELKMSGTRVLLAVELHRARRGSLPEKLEELVPELLPAIPKDAVSGKGLVYRKVEGGRGYVLYSVGVDGVDDGGGYSEMGNINALIDRGWARGTDLVFSVPGVDPHLKR